jgi:hypothetical protein
MMTRYQRFSALLLLLTVVAASSTPQTSIPEPVRRELQLVYVFDTDKPEFILVIGQSGFRSVETLKEHLKTWPPGSELKWAPGCERFGGEPLSSAEDLAAFKTFLEERQIKFVFIPSG